MRSYFTCLLQLFADCQKKGASAHFYKCFKTISLASFIQILFIYKWHARNFNIHFSLWCHDPIWSQREM